MPSSPSRPLWCWRRWRKLPVRGQGRPLRGRGAEGRGSGGGAAGDGDEMNWPDKKYRVILADPPWAYKVWSDKGTGRSAEQHYSTMTAEGIRSLPVSGLAEKDCVLLMWATYPCLPQAFETMAAWGFTYKTVAFTWVKADTKMIPFIGLGHWTRSNAEICLLGTIGNPKRRAKDVEQIILSPVREHSRKPDVQYDRIERLVEGPYCELFSRYPRPGWDRWGNETLPTNMSLFAGAMACDASSVIGYGHKGGTRAKGEG